MRPFVLGLFLSVAVLFPKTGNAQVYQFRTAPPEVTAADDHRFAVDLPRGGGGVHLGRRGAELVDLSPS